MTFGHDLKAFVELQSVSTDLSIQDSVLKRKSKIVAVV